MYAYYGIKNKQKNHMCDERNNHTIYVELGPLKFNYDMAASFARNFNWNRCLPCNFLTADV